MNDRGEEVAFTCPHCDTALSHLISEPSEFTCHQCNQDLDLHIDGVHPATRQIQSCLVCGNPLLYVQKDFNRILGVSIVLVGIVLSFWTYGISLLVAAAIDFMLYRILKDVTVCYRCEAIHREFPLNSQHSAYDIHVAEQFEGEY